MALTADRLMASGRRHLWKGVALALALVIVSLTTPTEAHKAITSKYNYNEHIFPILRDRCAGCHFEGGPTPMSLTTYRDALPWAESIREQLMAQKMPPWYADPIGPKVRGGHDITTGEIDALITWSVGGAPEGALATESPTYDVPEAQWSAGAPDLKIQMPAEHSLPPGKIEETVEVTLDTGLKEETWVNAVDLLPGNRSVVRDAVVSLQNGPVLAAWVPGHQPTQAPSGAAFKLPAGAKLTLQMHYKKHWTDEQNTVSDQSTVGLYYTEAPLSGRELEALTVKAADAPEDSHETRTFGTPFTSNARVMGVRASFDEAYAQVDVDAVLPAGRRITIMKLRSAQPQWHRRYWLQEPIEIPQGAKLEVTARPSPPDEFGIPVPKRYPLQVSVDFVKP